MSPTLTHTTEIRREQGQTMAEYSVVLSLITVTVVGAVALLSGSFTALLGQVSGLLGG